MENQPIIQAQPVIPITIDYNGNNELYGYGHHGYGHHGYGHHGYGHHGYGHHGYGHHGYGHHGYGRHHGHHGHRRRRFLGFNDNERNDNINRYTNFYK